MTGPVLLEPVRADLKGEAVPMHGILAGAVPVGHDAGAARPTGDGGVRQKANWSTLAAVKSCGGAAMMMPLSSAVKDLPPAVKVAGLPPLAFVAPA